MEKNLSLLLNFAAVVECKSITNAAQLLGASKSSVSKKLKLLEQELNLKLVYREHKKLSVTPVGLEIYEKCKDLTQREDILKSTVDTLKRKPSGKLSISISSGLGEYFSSHIIPGFLQKFPEVEIRLAMNDDITGVHLDEFDVSIRVAASKYDDLVAKKIFSIESVVCASQDYLNQHGSPDNVEDLINHNCLLWLSEEKQLLSHWSFSANELEVSVPVQGKFQCNHLPSIKAAATQGLGIAYLPKYLIQKELNEGRLLHLFQGYCFTNTSVYAFFPPQNKKPKKLEVFIQYMAEYFSDV